jgi:hypothetical protein
VWLLGRFGLGEAMTDLQKLYLKARTELRCGHGRAVDEVSRVTGIEPGSVARSLARARREDERAEKRKAKETKTP